MSGFLFLLFTLHFTFYTGLSYAQVKFNVTLILTSGIVEVKVMGVPVWKKAEKKMLLSEKDEIRTSPGAKATLVFEDGSKVKLGENTTLAISELKADTVDLAMNTGKINADVKKIKKGGKFEINTPASVCAVRGTKFSIEVSEDGRTIATCYRGLLGIRQIAGLGEEITVRPWEKVEVLTDLPPMPPVQVSKEEKIAFFAPTVKETQNEVRMDMSREQVQAAAAQEIKLAEYQQGKSIIDAFGYRVRIEEYIVRPQADQFKMVVLNERQNRFDYFTWKATFNKPLPTDLREATKWLSWTDTMPEYWLKENVSAISNTVDIMEWKYIEGHVGLVSGKYKQLFDNFVFRLGQTGNMVTKLSYTGNNITSLNDVTWFVSGTSYTNANFKTWLNSNTTMEGAYMKILLNQIPNSEEKLYGKLQITFPGNKKYSEEYYIIDDEGNTYTWEKYLKEWTEMRWNQELVFKADEFKGPDGKIDLVVEPKIFQDAGIRIPSE